MYRVIFSDEATIDRQRIANWYENIRPDLKIECDSEIVKTIRTYLTKHPKIAQIIHGNIRRIPLKRFPFSVFYTIDEQKQTVQILAIEHHKQQPKPYTNN